LLAIIQEEAFEIWDEWAHLFVPGSPTRTLLDGIRDERWLVSVVHHNYKDENALWELLLADR